MAFRVDTLVATDEPKYPVMGKDLCLLFLVIEARVNGERYYFTEAGSLIINGKPIDPNQIGRWDQSRGDSLYITWFRVENVEGNYRNGYQHKVWTWDDIAYDEVEFAKGSLWICRADGDLTHLTLPRPNVGTRRFCAKVSYQGNTYSSPGKEAVRRDGIDRTVHRISFRATTGNDLLDWAYSFSGLPFIWGSTSITGSDADHQTEKYIGGDCADFLVAAARKTGYKVSFTGSYGLSRYVEKVVKPKPVAACSLIAGKKFYFFVNGRGDTVRFGESGVMPGDIIHWHGHVGYLAADCTPGDENKPNGWLDSSDRVLHTLFAEPVEEPLGDAYGTDITIERFKPQLRR